MTPGFHYTVLTAGKYTHTQTLSCCHSCTSHAGHFPTRNLAEIALKRTHKELKSRRAPRGSLGNHSRSGPAPWVRMCEWSVSKADMMDNMAVAHRTCEGRSSACTPGAVSRRCVVACESLHLRPCAHQSSKRGPGLRRTAQCDVVHGLGTGEAGAHADLAYSSTRRTNATASAPQQGLSLVRLEPNRRPKERLKTRKRNGPLPPQDPGDDAGQLTARRRRSRGCGGGPAPRGRGGRRRRAARGDAAGHRVRGGAGLRQGGEGQGPDVQRQALRHRRVPAERRHPRRLLRARADRRL